MAEKSTENVHQKFSTEALQSMKLPEVPVELSQVLSVSWCGKGDVPASSALGARVDKQGNPLATISMVYKKYIHEEEHPFRDVEKEFKIFVEVAREDLV